ncbi:MAG: hypothetical protein AAF351_00580 [Pseudomonadota bacterium]
MGIFPIEHIVKRGLAAFALLTLCASSAFAMTADEAFNDGNRLFRDDLYWAALLRYRQAAEAGMDNAMLHYNMGVAHYRAGQHTRANQSLRRAVRSPNLRVVSQFNLGLNSYKLGDIDGALDWFRQARDQEENARIRRLAIEAIKRINREQEETDELLVRVEKRREEQQRDFVNFDLTATVGFGTDDNVYNSPTDPYIDFSDPAAPTVTPEVTSGAFIPVDVRARYYINSLKFESFYLGYRLKGRYYQDQELENANEYSHELSFGSTYHKEDEERERSRRIFSAFTIAQHDQTFFDPDDGNEYDVGGELIGDRYNYVRYGPEITWVQSYRKFALGLRLKGQLWNYDDTEVVPEYDHEYFVFGAHAQYKFGGTSLIRFTVDKYSRRYSDRPSFDLNGQQLITNPTVRYDYLAAGVTARQRITDNMWFGFNYEVTQREDRFQGYYDYMRNEYGFDFQWTPSPRFKVEFGGYYRTYDFDNTFAFHNPAIGIRTQEAVRGNLFTEYRFSPHLSIEAQAEYRERTSTDLRTQYDRTWYSLGVTWRQ